MSLIDQTNSFETVADASCRYLLHKDLEQSLYKALIGWGTVRYISWLLRMHCICIVHLMSIPACASSITQ
jgi:hypothetical protein